jgi:hypothetical protein
MVAKGGGSANAARMANTWSGWAAIVIERVRLVIWFGYRHVIWCA